eukprot:CAMPEP_0198591246 /NCGR_PEP_ID=MMETSP1462-20131121/136649_1 /TAXON_ID=1333877 /ORGANISM="Brandtodinium nutriculum, Strain RCC3387" /LENGTH=232 /DNA_ID=CAMNT_0044322805 /DNA_START=13 /DNA_END=707 /DNA_ORIENTATION=-
MTASLEEVANRSGDGGMDVLASIVGWTTKVMENLHVCTMDLLANECHYFVALRGYLQSVLPTSRGVAACVASAQTDAFMAFSRSRGLPGTSVHAGDILSVGFTPGAGQRRPLSLASAREAMAAALFAPRVVSWLPVFNCFDVLAAHEKARGAHIFKAGRRPGAVLLGGIANAFHGRPVIRDQQRSAPATKDSGLLPTEDAQDRARPAAPVLSDQMADHCRALLTSVIAAPLP